MEKLTGHWVHPTAPSVVHVIKNGTLLWAADGSPGATWKIRADPVQKYGKDHFSVGERKRKGSKASTLRKCILRSSLDLEWMSPSVAQHWKRLAPNMASCQEVKLVDAKGSELALVDLKSEKILNVADLRHLIKRKYFKSLTCFADDISLTEVATGKLLSDESDVSSSDILPPVVRVSSYISDMISRNSLHLIFSDGKQRDVSVAEGSRGAPVQSIRDLTAWVATETQRPEAFITVYHGDPKSSPALSKYGSLQLESATLHLQLMETLGEWWVSKKLKVLNSDGTPCTSDLASAGSFMEARQIIARDTLRPTRFVRLLLGDERKEMINWDEKLLAEHEVLTLTAEMAPCIQELLQRGVQVKYMSGEVLDLSAFEGKTGIRAPCQYEYQISQLRPGQSVWIGCGGFYKEIQAPWDTWLFVNFLIFKHKNHPV
ncbi:FXR2 [Symbiodinium sp. CCMP2456]|nr:FXR2 [Symbiodinium sp. CCMP2456]